MVTYAHWSRTATTIEHEQLSTIKERTWNDQSKLCVCKRAKKKNKASKTERLQRKFNCIHLHIFTPLRVIFDCLCFILISFFSIFYNIFVVCFTLYFFSSLLYMVFCYSMLWCMCHTAEEWSFAIARYKQIHSKDNNARIWFMQRADHSEYALARNTHNIPIKRKNQIHEKKEQHCLVSRRTSTWMDCNCVYTMWAVRCVF